MSNVNREKAWREQMVDLASGVWTARKASWEEVCEEVEKFTGKPVSTSTEDALEHLFLAEIQKVLVGLAIEPDVLEALDNALCPTCFAMPGECKHKRSE